jgi:hypothetical protein
LLIGKIPHHNFYGKKPDNNLKERDDRSEILDTLGDRGNTDCLHAHIAYAGEKYMDRQNYPGAEFRIVHKKRQFFASCPFDISSFLSIDHGDSCTSVKILWKYLKKREKWGGIPDYAV